MGPGVGTTTCGLKCFSCLCYCIDFWHEHEPSVLPVVPAAVSVPSASPLKKSIVLCGSGELSSVSCM